MKISRKKSCSTTSARTYRRFYSGYRWPPDPTRFLPHLISLARRFKNEPFSPGVSLIWRKCAEEGTRKEWKGARGKSNWSRDLIQKREKEVLSECVLGDDGGVELRRALIYREARSTLLPLLAAWLDFVCIEFFLSYTRGFKFQVVFGNRVFIYLRNTESIDIN